MYVSDAFCSILINIVWNRYFQNSHVCRTQTNITFINRICLWQVLKKFQVFLDQAGTHLILNSYHSSSFFFFLNQSQQTQQGEKAGFPSPNWPAAFCCWSLGHITLLHETASLQLPSSLCPAPSMCMYFHPLPVLPIPPLWLNSDHTFSRKSFWEAALLKLA